MKKETLPAVTAHFVPMMATITEKERKDVQSNPAYKDVLRVVADKPEHGESMTLGFSETPGLKIAIANYNFKRKLKSPKKLIKIEEVSNVLQVSVQPDAFSGEINVDDDEDFPLESSCPVFYYQIIDGALSAGNIKTAFYRGKCKCKLQICVPSKVLNLETTQN